MGPIDDEMHHDADLDDLEDGDEDVEPSRPRITFDEYLEMLADPSAHLVYGGIRCLSDLTREQSRRLRELWPTLSDGRRRKLVNDAVDLAEDSVEVEFSAAFKAMLVDPDDSIRARAVEGLWENDEPATATLLLKLLSTDQSPRVRASTASVLSGFVQLADEGDLRPSLAKEIQSSLLKVVRDTSEIVEVRRRALESLSWLPDREVRRLIANAYKSPDDKMRASAVFAMGRNGHEEWLDTIVAELKNPEPEIRFEAARACGAVGASEAVRQLVALIADEDREVRLAAIGALGEIGGADAKRALEYTIARGDEEVREAAEEAIEALTFLNDPTMIPEIRVLGDDGDGKASLN